ncbi:peptidoglycan DD-metalloendopeptidase family protein [Asticcacaulis sp. EMRT-3]|uniref:murein hydrolase activator EnvC family protein n=1 Tax=Asticcacaulis sp. EMRT-3 TaxID=3040349 RepID=UPI0024AEDC5A|nr:peptidoglycan DD-metalloendopeptidase family protein [Asticcacaulis sp. EMRT-3]MDI7775737.1 peptidoglycan DD-metalloendopeptidase family protein [Asticcacaulis sp. EMRT-3]
MPAARPSLILAALAAAILMAGGHSDVDAQNSQRALTPDEQATLDDLEAQGRADVRKSDANRQTARQIGQEIEDLRQQIIDISKRQGASEQRSAIYHARLETLNLQETDITRRLTAARVREARLLSALQIYSRNPPPALFLAPRKANDAVMAAIIMKAITPELKKRTDILVQQNADLINLRRQAALQNEALLVTDSDVSEQRDQIENLISQKMALEDQLLGQADAMQAHAIELKAHEDRLRDHAPLRGLMNLIRPEDRNHLQPPVVGDLVRIFGQADGGPEPSRGVTYLAQPGSQVTAPAEGEVEFVGPVNSYGQVIIINIGHNYRVVITGVGRTYVEKGQTVALHEPLGRLPNLSDKKVPLYLELRKGDDVVNPTGVIQLAAN